MQALASTKDLVVAGNGKQADRVTLAEDVLSPYRQHDPARIMMEGGLAGLPARRARPFGLATDAAVSRPEGKVRLESHLNEASAGNDRISLIRKERNAGAIPPLDRSGFGTRLPQGVVAHREDMTALRAAKIHMSRNGQDADNAYAARRSCRTGNV